MQVVHKPPSQQTKAEKLKNLKAARAAKKRKNRKKNPKPVRIRKQVTPAKRKKPQMAKRRRTNPGTLTGGTGDVNPQLYSGRIDQTVINNYNTSGFISPVAKGIFAQKGRATVIEILKIWVDFTPMELQVAALEKNMAQILFISTSDHGTTGTSLGDADTLCMFEREVTGAFTAAGTYRIDLPAIMCQDLTDGAGHGILVASDYFYVQIGTRGFVATTTAFFKILYRFKNVPLVEYIGIVQSQQ